MEERNKTLVFEAFNTLYNKRNYEAAARYWSPNYIQHSTTSSRVTPICTSRS
jgi:predicted SnoaL-like aldol condensation-catalyzing enzyme